MFSSDIAHGHGTLVYPNGHKYFGDFKNDKRHGKGTYYFTDGDKEFGWWEDGELVNTMGSQDFVLEPFDIMGITPGMTKKEGLKRFKELCPNCHIWSKEYPDRPTESFDELFFEGNEKSHGRSSGITIQYANRIIWRVTYSAFSIGNKEKLLDNFYKKYGRNNYVKHNPNNEVFSGFPISYVKGACFRNSASEIGKQIYLGGRSLLNGDSGFYFYISDYDIKNRSQPSKQASSKTPEF
jgi:hypothetical protein